MDNPLWPPLMGNSRKKKKKLVQIKVRVDKSNTHSLAKCFYTHEYFSNQMCSGKKTSGNSTWQNEHLQHLYHNVN